LHLAVISGSIRRLEILLERDTDAIVLHVRSGYPPIFFAAAHGNQDMVDILLFNGSDPMIKAKSGFNLLHKAATSNMIQLALILLNKGAEVNAIQSFETPIHYAAYEENYDMIRLL